MVAVREAQGRAGMDAFNAALRSIDVQATPSEIERS